MRQTSHSSHDGAHRFNRTAVDHFGTVAMLILAVASLVLYFKLTSSGLLGERYLLLIMIGLIAVNVIHIVVQVPLRRNKLGKLLCGVLAVILSAGMFWFTSDMGNAIDKLDQILGKKLVENREIAVLVRMDDPAQDLGDTFGYRYGYVEGLNAEDTNDLLQHLKEQLGDFPISASPNPTALVDALYGSEVDAILLPSGAMTQLADMDEYADLEEKTRIIYTHTISREVEIAVGGAEITEPFVIYCNGIDSRKSDIHATGNSDVNILAVVNPKSREILLLNTPRDYYVPLHMNGQNDKLTHAGNYGI